MRGTGAREGTYRTAKYWGRAGGGGGGGGLASWCVHLDPLSQVLYISIHSPASL